MFLCFHPVTFLDWQAGVFANKELLFLGMREAFGPSARGNSFGLNSKHFQFTFYPITYEHWVNEFPFPHKTATRTLGHTIVPPNLESLGQSAAIIVGEKKRRKYDQPARLISGHKLITTAAPFQVLIGRRANKASKNFHHSWGMIKVFY